jgi:hypothetical protein
MLQDIYIYVFQFSDRIAASADASPYILPLFIRNVAWEFYKIVGRDVFLELSVIFIHYNYGSHLYLLELCVGIIVFTQRGHTTKRKCRIWGSHSGSYEEHRLLSCNAV